MAISYFGDVKIAAAATFPGSENHHVRLAKRILKGIDVVPTKDGRWVAKTDANPSSEVTQQLLQSVGLDDKLGFDEAKWSAFRVFLDEQVLKIRHKIAHGEGQRVDPKDFSGSCDRVLEACDSLVAQIEIAAKEQRYRSQSRRSPERSEAA